MQPKPAAPSPPAQTAPPGSPSFTLAVRVYYEDTDAAGVVYYANYLRFCERARTEWLRELGVGQQALMDAAGLAFVVRSVKADYLRAARLDDALEVVTRIAAVRGASLLFAQDIRRDGQLLFSAQVLIACIDLRRQKPRPFPAHLYSLFESLA